MAEAEFLNPRIRILHTSRKPNLNRSCWSLKCSFISFIYIFSTRTHWPSRRWWPASYLASLPRSGRRSQQVHFTGTCLPSFIPDFSPISRHTVGPHHTYSMTSWLWESQFSSRGLSFHIDKMIHAICERKTLAELSRVYFIERSPIHK